MKSKNNKLVEELKAYSYTPRSAGTSLSESKLNKLSTQADLLRALQPYMGKQAEADFKRRLFEQMMGDGTGKLDDLWKQEYPGKDEPQGRSLKEFLETLK